MQFMPKVQYFYHVTEKTWPQRKLLKPLTLDQIENRHGYSNRSDDEPDVPRICVAKNICGCLVAVPYSIYQPLYVYRTERRMKAAYTWGVCDAKITKERWLTQPTWFVKMHTIRRSILEEINDSLGFSYQCGDDGKANLRKQNKAVIIIRRILLKHNITETL